MTGSALIAVRGAFGAACITAPPASQRHLLNQPLPTPHHTIQPPALPELPSAPPASPAPLELPPSAMGNFSFCAAATEMELCFAVATSASLTLLIRTQQRATCSGPTSASSGSSILHRSTTNGHRGWNLQPGGGFDRSGGSPLMLTSRSLRASSTRGTDRSSDHVYGCCGLLKICSTGPSSTTLTAYITTTRWHRPASTGMLSVISIMAVPSSRLSCFMSWLV